MKFFFQTPPEVALFNSRLLTKSDLVKFIILFYFIIISLPLAKYFISGIGHS
jgi:hypothetical protein